MVMKRPAFANSGTLSISLLLLIAARSLGEIFRLHWMGVAAAQPETMYVTGALIAVLAALAATLLHVYGRRREILGLTAMTVFGLLIYKLVAG